MSDEAEDQQGSQPKKKGFLGVTMHMTGGRWLMVGTGGLMFLTAMGAMWLEGRNTNVDAGANVGVQANNGMRNSPGKSSPEYAAQVRAYNKKKAAEALAHGQSFVGIPVTSVTNENENVNPPPLTQPAQVNSVNENPQSSSSQQQPPQMQQPQADGSISKEIGVIATSMKSERLINPGDYIPEYRMPRVASSGLGNASSTSAVSVKSGLPAIRPGTIIYGVFENAMKSSTPGPVIGELVQGKYNGDRVIGVFQKPSNTNHLVIRLHTLVLPDGKTISIDAYAVSPKTTLPGMATGVNYHILARSASLLGAAFMAGVEGYGAAISQQGTTVMGSALGGMMTSYPMLTPTQTIDIAAGNAAQQLQPLQQQLAQNVVEPNTVTVAKGTPFGLLVVSSGKAAVATLAAEQKQSAATPALSSAPAPQQQGYPLGAGRALSYPSPLSMQTLR